MTDQTKIPAPEPVAYLYTDARTPQDLHPWLHSSMLVFAHDRRPTLRNEAALWTSTEAEAYAAAREAAARQAERETVAELRRLLARYRDETPLGHQPHMIAHLADKALGRAG